MNQLRILFRYIGHFLKSNSKNHIHSPFIFQFINEVLEDDRHFYAYDEVEKLRHELLKDERIIEVTDFGAGSTINASQKRTIKDIAKNSAKSPKYAQLLFRIVNHFQPKNMLELGTSLGISTLYQALAVKNSKFVTMEGCSKTARIAWKNFSRFQLPNLEITEGDFEKTLSLVLKKFSSLDFVFFDGNHQKNPTISYFEQCLSLAHNDSVFIFDDIHWSDEMEEAWEYIILHQKTTVTLDLFFIGIVFFKKELSKENFRYSF